MSPNWWPAIDKDASEIGDGEHASHPRTCWEQSPTLLALRTEGACASALASRKRLTLHPDFNIVCLNVLTAFLTTYKELRNPKTDVLEVRKFKIRLKINMPKGLFFVSPSKDRFATHQRWQQYTWCAHGYLGKWRRGVVRVCLCCVNNMDSLPWARGWLHWLQRGTEGVWLLVPNVAVLFVKFSSYHRHRWSNMRHWSFVHWQWHRFSTIERFSWSDTCTSSPHSSFFFSLSLS